MRPSKRGRATRSISADTAPVPAAGRPARAPAIVLALLLVAGIVATVHWPVLGVKALAVDDDIFVTHNPLVSRPGWTSAGRFFSEVLEPSTVSAYYLPLSMTSLMVDYALGGRAGDPEVFHRTNLALHVLNALLVLLLCRALDVGLVPAALAALLFGLHPLTVEPVASIGERKTLLATAFAFASIAGYLRWLERGGRAWKVASVLLYLLALLSKPSVTTLPAILLLLDVWRRRALSWRLIVEKWPFLLLSALSVVVTILSVARTWEFGALPETGVMRSVLRVCYVIVFYLGKILWPANLSPIYAPPATFTLTAPAVALAAVLVAALSALVAVAARRTRVPLVGWAGYVLALAPTFGILAWSTIIVYDRYVYFPALGLLILVAVGLDRAWSAAAVGGAWRRVLLLAPIALVLAAEARGTRTMLHHWRDSVSLWTYVTEVAPTMAESFNGLGVAREARFEYDAAIAGFRRAVALDPNYSWARLNLASGLLRRGETPEALEHFARARMLLPGDPKTAYMHGVALIQAGRLTEAEAELRRAVDLKPDHVAAISRLATLLALAGRVEESIAALERTVARAPDDAQPRLWLAVVLLRAHGRERDAIAHLREAARIAPDWPDPLNQLAWLLATLPDPALRDPEEAVRLARRAVELSGRSSAQVLDTQAAAEAAAGRFDEAVRVAGEALEVAARAPGNPFADGIRARLALYQRRTPYLEDPGGPAD